MPITDKQIGSNVARFRRDRSQQEIAGEMRQRGWKWSQATVWAVEKGERPLRLAESVDLASILGIFETELSLDDDSARLRAAIRATRETEAAVEQAIRALVARQIDLAIAGDLAYAEAPTERDVFGATALEMVQQSPVDFARSVVAKIIAEDELEGAAEHSKMVEIAGEPRAAELLEEDLARRGPFLLAINEWMSADA